MLPEDIIIKPIITEKSNVEMQAGKYTFEVNKKATKVDVKRAVEVAINNVTEKFGDVYANSVGHIELQYTARASYAVNKAFGAPLGKAFGLIVGAPAAIGVVIADVAVKAASVEVLAYSSPSKGTSYSNEAILAICGDSGAVKQAVLAAKEVGVKLLEAMGGEAPSASHPYI